MNFLEELAAEWYEFQGYFVRTNIHFGKRAGGGYEGEIDVLAFDPGKKVLVHIETSGAANSWQERKACFKKKFSSAQNHYTSIFPPGFSSIRKIAIVGLTHPKKAIDFGDGIEIRTVIDFINEISDELTKIRPLKEAVPEGFPLLRAIQFHLFAASKKLK